jgi:hypothetical protein
MEQKNWSTINLSPKQVRDVEQYCKLNNIEDISTFFQTCFIKGYEIEKFGLLTGDDKVIEKEIIVEKRVEIPVEVIIEKPIIEYVEIEKEIIKEIPREVIVEKIVEVTKEIPVEKVVEKTVEVIKEVPVDRVVVQEVIKEIPVEKVVTKTEYVTDDSKVAELVEELERVRNLIPTTVEREVIKEVPVPYEVVKEIEVVKEVTVEVPVEVIKEVIVEKTTTDTSKQKALEETIQKLRGELQLKNKEIQDLNNTIKEIQTSGGGVRGVFLDGSNLNRTINRI